MIITLSMADFFSCLTLQDQPFTEVMLAALFWTRI